MTLLIVDDQYASLHATARGIDWETIGITKVLTAQNAMEARLVFESNIPDILLCDIEMPVENGIELCQWVRGQGYETKIVFLTCHSEFDYARDAISLKAVEYILQPAPYNVIKETVAKAVMLIRAETQQRYVLDKAENYFEHKKSIGRSIWLTFLLEAFSEKSFEKLNDALDTSHSGYLVLLQIIQWNHTVDQWQDPLVTSALNSFLEDVFMTSGIYCLSTYVEHNIYSILLQPTEHGSDKNLVIQYLNYLCSIYDMYMPCAISCHLSDYIPIREMPTKWKELRGAQERNVTNEKGVFTSAISSQWDECATYKPQISHWKDLLALQEGIQVGNEAFALLDDMVSQHVLTAETLLVFYQSFMRLLYTAGEDGFSQDVNDLFNTPETIELYRNGMKSVEDMKNLISYVSSRFSSNLSKRRQKETVQMIIEYIDENLGGVIRKEDIVRYVHLNTDYVTKLFKKETGLSIKAYIIQQKLYAAQKLLRTTTLPVSYVAARFGYSNFSHFTTSYKKQFGISPHEEKKNSG